MLSYIALLPLAIGLANSAAISGHPKNVTPSCRYIPGDAGWPAAAQWDRLNRTVEGRLISTTPIAHVCHEPSFSDAQCTDLKQQWDVPALLTTKPAEILHPWFQNQSCVPFTPQSSPCELGNYASYSINVSNVHDIKAGLAFAEKHNVRLVMKNTGHDYLGKSTGKGALSLWTHNLNSKEVLPAYKASYYHGPALKVGAGVMGGDAGEFAAKRGYRFVVGNCPDVGVAGGYTQGGGHSLLTGLYGLAAENVLEWEVVTASGRHLVASPTKNTDLYWALSGGGAGTYAVVVSLTIRIFPDGQIAGSSLSFGVDTIGSVDEYWGAVEVFVSHLQGLVDDHGMVAAFMITNNTLDLYSIMAPGNTSDELTTLMHPMVTALEKKGAKSLGVNTTDAQTYFDLYSATLEPIVAPNPLSPVMGGRFVSRTNMGSKKSKSKVIDSMRAATEGGKFWIACTALSTKSAVRMVDPVASNAAQPAFSDAFLSMIVGAAWSWTRPWHETAQLQDDLIRDVMPALEGATPGADAYVNEANWQQQNWQQVFYGSNYNRLRAIKSAHDPHDLFYGLTSVGSEVWSADADGRLCRTDL